MKFLAIFLCSFCDAICPEVKFFCPDGAVATVPTKWNWKKWNCVVTGDLDTLLDAQCNWFSCGSGGVQRYKTWADGCSDRVRRNLVQTERFHRGTLWPII